MIAVIVLFAVLSGMGTAATALFIGQGLAMVAAGYVLGGMVGLLAAAAAIAAGRTREAAQVADRGALRTSSFR